MKSKLKVAVIGGSGFTGLELLKILNNHPLVEVSFTTSKTYDGMNISIMGSVCLWEVNIE